MLVYFTDAVSKARVAVNPKFVTAVLPPSAEDEKAQESGGQSVIGLINGAVLATESMDEVVGIINGALK
jgi:hypothetical protein